MHSDITDKEIKQLQQQLKQRYLELRGEISEELLKSDNEHFKDLAGQVGDLEDLSVADLLVDLNLANIDRHIQEIRDIDAALISIAEKNYGICVQCDNPINPQRLKAQPTATRCLECANVYEKTHAHPSYSSL
jgi:DnaK suppressor protein